VLFLSSSGAWAEEVTAPSSTTWKIPSSLAVEEAALLPAAVMAHGVLACQPLLLPGDAGVVSGADTAVGLALRALCTHRGLKLVEVPAVLEHKDAKLLAAGKVKLVLAQASGQTVLSLSRALQADGVLVCVAGAVEPLARDQAAGGVTVPVSPLIFSSVSVRGLDLRAWACEQQSTFREALAQTLALVAGGQLRLPAARVFAARDGAGMACEAVRGSAAAVAVRM